MVRGKEGRRASYLAGRFFFLCFTFACFLPAANVLVALPSSSVSPSITLNSFRKVDLLESAILLARSGHRLRPT